MFNIFKILISFKIIHEIDISINHKLASSTCGKYSWFNCVFFLDKFKFSFVNDDILDDKYDISETTLGRLREKYKVETRKQIHKNKNELVV